MIEFPDARVAAMFVLLITFDKRSTINTSILVILCCFFGTLNVIYQEYVNDFTGENTYKLEGILFVGDPIYEIDQSIRGMFGDTLEIFSICFQ